MSKKGASALILAEGKAEVQIGDISGAGSCCVVPSAGITDMTAGDISGSGSPGAAWTTGQVLHGLKQLLLC
jgi:hypothetical protein